MHIMVCIDVGSTDVRPASRPGAAGRPERRHHRMKLPIRGGVNENVQKTFTPTCNSFRRPPRASSVERAREYRYLKCQNEKLFANRYRGAAPRSKSDEFFEGLTLLHAQSRCEPRLSVAFTPHLQYSELPPHPPSLLCSQSHTMSHTFSPQPQATADNGDPCQRARSCGRRRQVARGRANVCGVC